MQHNNQIIDDMHIHTIYSDGSEDIQDIVTKTNNFGIFSITDHNNINACKKIKTNNFSTGVEISGLINKHEYHILGYNFCPYNNRINKIFDDYNYYNNEIFINILKKIIEKYKLKLDYNLIYKYIDKGITLNKVILSKILLENNVGDNLYEIYNRYVKEFLRVTYYYIELKDIIDAIKSNNGYLFLAHPFGYYISEIEIRKIIKKLVNAGIDGIEITEDSFNKTMMIIEKYNLLYSIGSDYHGKEYDRFNKLGIDTTLINDDKRYIKNKII